MRSPVTPPGTVASTTYVPSAVIVEEITGALTPLIVTVGTAIVLKLPFGITPLGAAGIVDPKP